MAAVAVRKKVISIGHFSLSFCLQSFFHLLYQIKSYCINWLHWKLEKNRTEQNKLDKREYLKSFIKTASYGHWPVFFVFARSNTCPNIYSFIPFEIRKKTEPNELNELDYSKTFTWMSSRAHEYVFLYLHAQTNIKILLYWSYTKS